MADRSTRGVVPGSRLDYLLARLARPERRLLLGVLAAKDSPRRARMERELERRLKEKGINPNG